MDLVSIVGVIASVLSIVDVVAKSIRKLSDLKSRYRNAPLQVSTLIGQLYIIQAVIQELATWRSKNLTQNPRYIQLATQIDTSLDCFCPLLLALEQQLSNIDLSSSLNMDPARKMSFIWNERDLNLYLNLIDRQINALNLFLQAVQCRNWTEQQELISETDNQTILRLARDCSSSVLGLQDDASICTEDTNAISLEFDFDALILGSRAYQTAHRSHLRRLIKATKKQEQKEQHDQDLDEDKTVTAHLLISQSVVNTDGVNISIQAHPVRNDLELRLNPMTNPTELTHRDGKLQPWRDSNSRLLSRVPILRSLRKIPGQRSLMEQSYREVMERLGRDDLQRPNYIKILLLGASESGKTTLLQRMQLHFKGRFSTDQRSQLKYIIRSNVMNTTFDVLEAMEVHLLLPEDSSNHRHAQTLRTQSREIENFSQEVETAIKALWADIDFLKAYLIYERSKYGVRDCGRKYAQDVTRLAQEDYMPTNQDILMSRKMTRGVHETSFNIKDTHYKLKVFDVGGVVPDRKKWFHILESTTTVIFCVDATAYFRINPYDWTTNRMHDQLALFDRIVNFHSFERTSFILMFTGFDQLDELLSIHLVADYFPDFETREQETTSDLRNRYMGYLITRFTTLIEMEEKRTQIGIICADLIHTTEVNPVEEMMEMIMRDVQYGNGIGLGKVYPSR